MVPKGRLELPRVAPHGPQPCASTNSATSACNIYLVSAGGVVAGAVSAAFSVVAGGVVSFVVSAGGATGSLTGAAELITEPLPDFPEE